MKKCGVLARVIHVRLFGFATHWWKLPLPLVWCLTNNYTFAAMDFGRRLGASDEHIPQWICKERATTPPPKRHAALRVALKLAWGFVAQSVEYRWGYTPSFAPRPRPI